jgi:hypothetical protein
LLSSEDITRKEDWLDQVTLIMVGIWPNRNNGANYRGLIAYTIGIADNQRSKPTTYNLLRLEDIDE